MDAHRVLAGFLVLVGCAGLGSASISTTESNIVVFATVLSSLIGLGLIATGGSWIFHQRVGHEVRSRIPGGTLILVGCTCILGSLILFQPWQSTITQGFRTGLTGGLSLVGGGLILGGWRWGREQQVRYPLGLLTGGVVLGISYIVHQTLNIFVSAQFTVLIGLVALLVTVTVGYFAPSRVSTPTSE